MSEQKSPMFEVDLSEYDTTYIPVEDVFLDAWPHLDVEVPEEMIEAMREEETVTLVRRYEVARLGSERFWLDYQEPALPTWCREMMRDMADLYAVTGKAVEVVLRERVDDEAQKCYIDEEE